MNTRRGFSIVETMIGITLGIILSIAILSVYLAQKNTYRTNTSQALIQNTESAIAALMIPTIRSAGFCGCNSAIFALSNLNEGGPPPLGSLSTTPSIIYGYDASAGTTINITQDNAANSSQSNQWSPGLDRSLTGNVQPSSDIISVFGPPIGTAPIGIITITSGSSSFTLQSATSLAVGGFGAISDCLKATVFQITNVTGATISHTAGTGALTNASSGFTNNYQPGAQFVQIIQTAFFVANDPSGQSALRRATLNPDGTWSIQSLVPGVDTMQVLYGIGSNGVPAEYVPASAVTNWGQVYAVRLGFLLEGQVGSATLNATTYSVLGTTVNVPADNRLRHVFEMTIQLRNAQS